MYKLEGYNSKKERLGFGIQLICSQSPTKRHSQFETVLSTVKKTFVLEMVLMQMPLKKISQRLKVIIVPVHIQPYSNFNQYSYGI